MKRKIIGICIGTLLISTVFSFVATAGDEENPEINDEDDNKFDYIDITSGWFSEKEDEQDYLFLTLKLVDLTHRIGTVYAIHWDYNEVHYDVSLHNGILIPPSAEKIWGCHYYRPHFLWFWREIPIRTWNESLCSGVFDVELDLITWKIHKSCIDNPQPGEVLMQPRVFTAQRISKIGLIPLGPLSFELSDATSGIEGEPYTIQY